MVAPLDASVPYVAKRFAVRLLILTLCSAIPVYHGPRVIQIFVLLTEINVVIGVILAMLNREKPFTRALTHWDEALAMLGISLTARMFV